MRDSKVRFSILGDSISTLEGCNPQGYSLFYTGQTCEQTGVREMADTWWGRVIGYFGGELLVNNSWSGSRVTKLPDRVELFPSACSDERTAGLHRDGKRPDVILIFLGVNDWARGVPLQGSSGNEGAPERFFADAYTRMLSKLCSNYPNAEIWCATLCGTAIARKPAFVFPKRFGGIHIDHYNHIIRAAAVEHGCGVMDFDRFQCPYDSIDGTHPTAKGMKTLAELAIRAMEGDSGAEQGILYLTNAPEQNCS